jgi:bifunctional non-homologous end joining protein LigD
MQAEFLPMLASASTGASGRDPVQVDQLMATGDWVLDTKLDGVRAMLMPDGRILNRKGVDVARIFPEVVAAMTDQSGGSRHGWLDGEIVAVNGSFETTLMRESQSITAKIRRAADEHPCRFVAFDLPALAKQPWSERRERLERLADDGVLIAPVSYDMSLWTQTRAMGMEGVIAKRLVSRYRFGRRSRDWVKFKHLHRVSCLLAGYTPGSGSREHFGALLLALVDERGTVVPVGRCGSGFTERQTHDLKSRLDAGELLVGEIETINITSGGTLRFPVFRGLRTDVAPADCTTTQLAALPRC